MGRGENLDINWLKDESEGNGEEQFQPTVLVKEAMNELSAALDGLREILVELGDNLEK